MKTKDHAILAGYLARNASNQVLKKHKKAFILGNVVPDINVFTRIKGHKFEKSIPFIEKRFQKLIHKGKWRTKEFYRFGKIMHYITDYFTHAHNQCFSGNIRKHREYEKALHFYFIEYLDFMRIQYTLNSILKEDLLSSLMHFHNEYLNTEISVENDCRYILSICLHFSQGVA